MNIKGIIVQEKAREYWIVEGAQCIVGSHEGDKDATHVIEKSAYDKLLKKQIHAACTCSELKVQADKLAEALELAPMLVTVEGLKKHVNKALAEYRGNNE